MKMDYGDLSKKQWIVIFVVMALCWVWGFTIGYILGVIK